jgi:hypothetical protein
MPDLWDTNPRNAFSTPDEQPDLAPDDDHTKEMMLKDHRGHLYSVEMAARTSSRAARGWQRPRPGNLVGFDRHRRVCAQAEHARSDAASTTRDQLCRHHRPSTAPTPSGLALLLWCRWSAVLPFIGCCAIQNRRSAWGCSSVGRAPALQAGGRGFESHHLHHQHEVPAQHRYRRPLTRLTGARCP